MEKKFLYQDSVITYNITGDGIAVMLIHGFGEESSIWDKQTDFLRNYCTVITPDLPGSGKSDMLLNEEVEIADYAACINALLEHESMDQCILLGHSMGGYITLALAEKYPERLKGFGLVHSTAFADSSDKKANRLQGIKMIQEHGAYSFLKNTTPNLFSKHFKNVYNDQVNSLIEKGKQCKPHALIQYYTAMMNRPDLNHVLMEAKIPVLFIIGTEDNAAPLKDLLQQVHLPDISYIHTIENVGHMSMMEAPEKLNNYLTDFILNSTHRV